MKCHLVTERTIVVESDGSTINNQRNQNFMSNHPLATMNNNLLDEGSLLLLKISAQNNEHLDEKAWVNELISFSAKNTDEEAVVIPLGKILEVFGPIFKPL